MNETLISSELPYRRDQRVGHSIVGSILKFVFFRIIPRLIEAAWVRPRNAIFSIVLQSHGFQVGSNARILNSRCIHIGPYFTALNDLWLETIENGDRYHPSLVIGKHVTCSNFVHIAATHSVTIGDHVLIGSNVIITDHNHGIYRGATQSSPDQPPRHRDLTNDGVTTIEDNVWIGDGVTILPGSHVGNGSIIGANSTVNSSIPADCIAVGNPAKPIRRFDHASHSWQPYQKLVNPQIQPDHRWESNDK